MPVVSGTRPSGRTVPHDSPGQPAASSRVHVTPKGHCAVSPTTFAETRQLPFTGTEAIVELHPCSRETKTEMVGFATMNGNELEVPPPGAGFVTVTAVEPAGERSAAGTETMICVPAGLTKMLDVRLSVPKPTVDVDMKFVPLMVRSIGPAPMGVVVGERDIRVGTGLLAPATLMQTC